MMGGKMFSPPVGPIGIVWPEAAKMADITSITALPPTSRKVRVSS